MTRKVNKLLSAALTLLIVAALALSLSACGKETASTPSDGTTVSITVEIVDDKGEKTTLELETSEVYLADALVAEGIVEYQSDGMYTTVNGVTADYSKDGSWWCVTKGGTMTTEGMNTLKLADGDKYEVTYTK